MQDLELRVQTLEKKCRALKQYVVGLTCCAVLAAMSGAVSLNRSAKADAGDEINPKDIGIPAVVEAQVFMLKDAAGNIRGIWNADDATTSFAMMHKGKFPIIAMAVDNKNASMALTDVYKGKINIGLSNSIRSMSVTDDTGKNNIYLGLTGTGEASIDMVSTGDSSVVIDGKTSSIDMTGDRAVLAMTETVGSTAALQAQPGSSALTFMDHANTKTLDITTIDGKTTVYMNSPATKENKTLTTAVEVLNISPAAQKNDEQIGENGEAAAQPAENKKDDASSAADLKNYSPFGK
jgi:hypothetical protein